MEPKVLDPEVTPENTNETPEATPGEASKEEAQTPDPNEDPLDKITDPEELRKIAKAERGKAQRYGKKPEKAPVSSPAASAELVTKKDFHKINEKSAIEQVTTVSDSDSDEDKQIKKDLNEHWNDIKKHYAPKSGRDRVKDIVEDIFDAHAAWKRRGGVKAPDTSKEATAELARSAGKPGGGKPAQTAKPSATKIPRPTQMTDWFKKS